MKPASVSAHPVMLLLIGITAFIAPECPAEESINYIKEIKPILAEKCYACHGAIRQEAGLRLETRELLLKGGDSGPVLVEHAAADSLLLHRVSTPDLDLRMPPEGEGAPLSPEQLDLLTRWINSGAAAPPEEIPASPSQHWAFQPVVRPQVPSSKPDSARILARMNAVDAFIGAGYERHRLQPVQTASRELLLRRAYLDLIGLPPTAAQRQQFLSDDSPQAFERLVDQLLASPQYGERWGRHWMDVWRYADWYGLGAQLRNSQKHIWHWRDWIIESLNADTGYDQMLREMLAADELYPTDRQKLRATGFLARHYYLFNRTTWLDDTVEHTSKAFLGLTMNCVKCHAHKYDPIAHEDYYAFRAFFEPYQVRLDALPGEADLEKNGLPRVFDAHPDVQTFLHIRGDEKKPDMANPVDPHLPAILTFAALEVVPIELPPVAINPALQPFVLEDRLQLAQAAIVQAEGAVVVAQQRLDQINNATANQVAASEEVTDFIVDEFDALDGATWEIGPGKWAVEDGLLIQSQAGAARAYLRTKQQHPQDFLATIRFTTTGGDKWRSVGLAFDITGTTPGQNTDSVNEKMIYLSAVEAGSKLQVSYKVAGSQVYPPKAAKTMPVLLNTPYELTVAIRGELVNVALNGEHKVAYQLPVGRDVGVMDVVAFDATVKFDSLVVRSLPANQTMIAAGSDGDANLPMTAAAARHAVRIARLELAAARLYPEVLRTAFAADRAKAGLSAFHAADLQDGAVASDLPTSHPASFLQELTAKAALASRRHELAVARLKLAQAELKPDDAKLLTAAKAAVTEAQKRLEAPGESYPRIEASLKALEGPDETDNSRRQPYPETSTGRRTALARWMTDQRNPLTARVAINHIWMRHFGQPLVETETDFGLRAVRPVQHELLDWLAAELMENNWSMKHIHRLIMTSQCWQLASSTMGCDDATLAADPDNNFYWRRKPLRMESQVVRDSLLQLAGALDLTMGGPSLDANSRSTNNRRSLYFKHSRDDQNEFLAMFDDADILRCYRRSESVVPQQALALANSELALTMARRVAANITSAAVENSADDRFVTAAFEIVLCRQPTAQELAVCLDAMSETRSVLQGKSPDQIQQRSRENLVHALINHNDFITVR